MEHDNFIFICSFIYHVSQCQQLLPVGQDCAAPGWVPFVTNHNLFFKGLDRFVQNRWVLVLIRACELVLVIQEKVLKRYICENTKTIDNKQNTGFWTVASWPPPGNLTLDKEYLLRGSFSSNIERYNFGFTVTCTDLMITLDKDT